MVYYEDSSQLLKMVISLDSVNCVEKNLMKSIHLGDMEAVQEMIKGQNVNSIDDEGVTPLHEAALSGNYPNWSNIYYYYVKSNFIPLKLS